MVVYTGYDNMVWYGTVWGGGGATWRATFCPSSKRTQRRRETQELGTFSELQEGNMSKQNRKLQHRPPATSIVPVKSL